MKLENYMKAYKDGVRDATNAAIKIVEKATGETFDPSQETPGEFLSDVYSDEAERAQGQRDELLTILHETSGIHFFEGETYGEYAEKAIKRLLNNAFDYVILEVIDASGGIGPEPSERSPDFLRRAFLEVESRGYQNGREAGKQCGYDSALNEIHEYIDARYGTFGGPNHAAATRQPSNQDFEIGLGNAGPNISKFSRESWSGGSASEAGATKPIQTTVFPTSHLQHQNDQNKIISNEIENALAALKFPGAVSFDGDSEGGEYRGCGQGEEELSR